MSDRDPLDPFILDQRGEAFVDGYRQAVQDAEGFAYIHGHDTSDGVVFGKLRANSDGYESKFAAASRARATRVAPPSPPPSDNPLAALIEADHAAVDGMVENTVVFVLERAAYHIGRMSLAELEMPVSVDFLLGISYAVSLLDPEGNGRDA